MRGGEGRGGEGRGGEGEYCGTLLGGDTCTVYEQ